MHSLAACCIATAFGFFGSMPLVGPIALMVLSRAARGEFGEARRIGLGAAVAEGIYAGVAFWGFATFLAKHACVVPISHGMTAALLVGLGARFAVWRPAARPDRRESKSGTALVGFSVSALNPTLFVTWSATVAFIYSKGLGNQPAVVALPFGASAAAGVSGWVICFVALLRRYEGKLPRTAMIWTVRAMAVVLVGLGAWSGIQLARWIDRASSERATATCPSWRASPRT